MINKGGKIIETNQLVPVPGKNAQVVKIEYDVLVDLEEKIGGKIPIVDKIEWNTFGFIVENNHIVGLVLTNKGLSSLPEIITKMTWLKRLDLSSNQLTSLPDTIGNLESLKELYLASNKLTSLPDSIGNLTSLEELNLRENKLSSIPEKTRKKLRELEENGCSISSDRWVF